MQIGDKNQHDIKMPWLKRSLGGGGGGFKLHMERF